MRPPPREDYQPAGNQRPASAWPPGPSRIRLGPPPRWRRLIRLVRDTRNRYQIENRTPLTLLAKAPASIVQGLQPLHPVMRDLAGLGELTIAVEIERPKLAASAVESDFEAFVLLEGIIDPAAERQRLTKQRQEKEKAIAGIRAKLGNESFVQRAPAELVEQQRATLAELEEQIRSIDQNMASLPG
jgi:valyl-tRNA synthetase